jgi:hypothetical protein
MNVEMRICPKNEKCNYNWFEILHGCHLITVILEYSEHYTIEPNKTKQNRIKHFMDVSKSLP